MAEEELNPDSIKKKVKQNEEWLQWIFSWLIYWANTYDVLLNQLV